jgi:quercetin dioxygenase-like cupin family protein
MPPTDLADTTSWQRVASRASHPSAVSPVLEPGDLLREIAAGMGLVTVPAELAVPPRSLSRELVLTTPAYDVWVMSWPAGETADLHAHEHHVAFHVVSGSLLEERYEGTALVRATHRTGDTVVVPPHTPHRVASAEVTTTVHVHAKERA